MTVKELIAALQKEDQDVRVVVRGYEGGVNDASRLKPLRVLLGSNIGTWYYGKHDRVEEWTDKGNSEEVDALELCGDNTDDR